ncbi:Het-C-domain-containing protein [Neolentinus lepideus HHB14362 ss-1]|uniref:Het-C-domain-containing protein n=1 Tax=Neolentinus lepideus HHB14362 ss-1 TaxID=1314782 RepID=A0A165SVT1_9AGAM|nr:Het-C-domain-containing protein [Neolentinus lepideus HHB14362 ss-1]
MSANNSARLWLLLCVLFICLSGVHAFGAGNIPSFAYLEGRAFRHGDIEDTLAELLKKGSAGGGIAALGSLIGKGGSKFGGLDVKRVYFGNWLRDYSQAVDIASLKKLQLQTIINLCMILGFLAHGYATHEFEVTEERLGCYLPTEHIDNPKGYGEGEDARKYDRRLRGPVNPQELEVDPRTGMKNYIANENGSWDTSKALVRRTLEQCIHLGRQARAQGRKQDEYESYRLLGQALHTLEDFTAHSNFCELALVSLGHKNVFVHIGDNVRIQAPNGQWVAPLVTGTFGSSDFTHSLLGEATDHISEASVSDLNRELNNATAKSRSMGGGTSPADVLRDLLFKLPGGGGNEMSREMETVERIRAGPSQPGAKRPEDMNPQEIHAVLWQVLTFRDSVVKKIEMTIERIPGLGPLVEKLMDSIQVFIYTTLEPYLKPLMKVATDGLMSASGEVINTHDQYEVFNDPRASDPTHSFLSKDHFSLILNEPAGHLAKIIVAHTVGLVVKAWDDASMSVHHVTEDVLQCLFHPDFHNPSSQIQTKMLHYMREWLQSLGHRQSEVLRRLTKEAVRSHENIRLPGEGVSHPTGIAYDTGLNVQHDIQGYVAGIPGVSQAQNLLGKIGNRPGMGSGREVSSPGPGYSTASRPPVSSYASEPPTGEAAGYYGQGQGHGGSSYAPPLGGPSFPDSSAPGGGAPPPPPPHHTRPHHGGHAHVHHQDSSYQPGYTPSYTSPSPSFPDAGGYTPGGPGGYAPPSGPPPGGFAPPPGPPGGPGFPAPDPWGAPPGGPSFPQAYPGPGGGGNNNYGGFNDSRDQRW